MSASPQDHPDWDRLYEIAATQEGFFTTKQAGEAGYSAQLLIHHVRKRRIERTQRGIYRLVHFPAAEHEDLVVAWLWSEQVGVISHQTALALHGLSDVLPAHVHLTLPVDWKHRRFRVPANIVLHYANVPSDDRSWFGAVPTTSPKRAIIDCALEGLSPELLRQAVVQALSRGLVTQSELARFAEVREALEPFGGIPDAIARVFVA